MREYRRESEQCTFANHYLYVLMAFATKWISRIEKLKHLQRNFFCSFSELFKPGPLKTAKIIHNSEYQTYKYSKQEMKPKKLNGNKTIHHPLLFNDSINRKNIYIYGRCWAYGAPVTSLKGHVSALWSVRCIRRIRCQQTRTENTSGG